MFLQNQAIGLSHLVLRVLDSVLANELELHQLQQLFRVGNALEDLAEVCKSLVMIYASKGGKGIALAGGVALALQEGSDQLRGIGDERGRVNVDRRDGEDGVLSDVRVAVLEAGPCRGEERLDQFGFAKFAQKPQRVSADILVGVLQVVTNTVTHQDHLLFQLALGI